MANERLRAALQDAGLQPDDLAEIVEVDIRSVRRWLSGRSPYPRQRAKVARALDTTEHDLWPQITLAPPPRPPAGHATDLVAAYPSATDLTAPDWKALLRGATEQIELLGDTLAPILATPNAPELLVAKTTQGCKASILLADPSRYLTPLVHHAGIQIRILEVPVRYTLHRFDQQLLFALSLLGETAEHAPLLHLQRAAPDGLFDRFTEHYRYLWDHAARPLDPDLDVYGEDEYEGEGEDESDTDADPRHLVVRQAEPVQDLSSSARRRWPRRPG